MTQLNVKNAEDPKGAVKTHATDWKLELSALSGFCLSGAIFVISGIKNKDILTISGSLVWMISCLVWMIPYKKYFNFAKQKP